MSEATPSSVLQTLRRWAPASGLAAAALLLAACGATVAHTAAKKPSGSIPVGISVKTATVAVNGTAAKVFTNAAGYTLYYFVPDSASHTVCTSSLIGSTGTPCSTIWPPLVAPTRRVTGPEGVSGRFSVFSGPNGQEVEYNGHPLYTYSIDTGPGQSHGQGVLGKWYVATPGLSPNSAPAPSPSSSSSSGGSGYSYS